MSDMEHLPALQGTPEAVQQAAEIRSRLLQQRDSWALQLLAQHVLDAQAWLGVYSLTCFSMELHLLQRVADDVQCEALGRHMAAHYLFHRQARSDGCVACAAGKIPQDLQYIDIHSTEARRAAFARGVRWAIGQWKVWVPPSIDLLRSIRSQAKRMAQKSDAGRSFPVVAFSDERYVVPIVTVERYNEFLRLEVGVARDPLDDFVRQHVGSLNALARDLTGIETSHAWKALHSEEHAEFEDLLKGWLRDHRDIPFVDKRWHW